MASMISEDTGARSGRIEKSRSNEAWRPAASRETLSVEVGEGYLQITLVLTHACNLACGYCYIARARSPAFELA
jgi:DNA repair photolyase